MSFQFKKSGELKPLTEAELLEADKGPPMIVRDQGTASDGRKYWLYIAVKPSRYKEFYRLTKAHQTIRFSDYGKILRFGYGTEIPQHVQDEMKRVHGFDEQYEEKIMQQARGAQKAFKDEQENKRIISIVEMMKQKSN